MDFFSSSSLFALAQVVAINLILSGDNVVVIGMVAARVAPADRPKVITWGMATAVALRVLLSIVAVDLLRIIGLTLAGGILLLWVAWRLYRDLREQSKEKHGAEIVAHGSAAGAAPKSGTALPFRRAIVQIAIADLSMSVDNVLAIAGAASKHFVVLLIGLFLSVALMGVAATYVAKLLERYQWLSYIGVLLIVYVAGEMVWEGSDDVPRLLKLLPF